MAKDKKCEVLVLNNVAQVGLKRFPAERYSVVKDSKDPWAILVRSADLHKHEFGPSLRAVGRAGAGVNNIPVAALSRRGIPVFNAPGANANVPDMLGRISHALGKRKINIHNMLNKSKGEMAYTLVDTDTAVSAEVIAELEGLDGVLAVRYLPADG